MKRITVYIVQGDPRDHKGEIISITADKNKALDQCAKLISQWNKPTDKGYLGNTERMIQADYKAMKRTDFLAKYLGSAWISSPQLVTMRLSV